MKLEINAVPRWVLWIVGAVLVIVAVFFLKWLVFDRAERLRVERDIARGTATIEKGRADAAGDSAVIVDKGAARDAAIEKEVEDEARRILALPESKRHDATIAALCLRDVYRTTETCTNMQRLRSD